MAVFKESITTRYGDTFTAADDNSSDFASDMGSLVTLSSDVITVTGDARGDLSEEYVIFNKKIIIENDGHLLGCGSDGNGNVGNHVWFVNCTIIKEGQGNNASCFIGPVYGENSSVGGREDVDAITTGSKDTDVSWNYYGCSFVIETDNSEYTGVVIAGNIEDCDFTLLGDATESGSAAFQASPIIQPVIGGSIDGLVVNAGARQDSLPTTMFLWRYDYTLNGLVFNNTFPYIGGGAYELQFDEYFAAGSAQRGSNDVRCLIGNQNAVTMVNPKIQFDTNGSIAWRGNNSTTGRLIQSQRIERDYFSDAALTEGRKDVKVAFDTTLSFSGNNRRFINTSGTTKTEYVYTTGTDGIPEGTVDINDTLNTVTSQDFTAFDLPVNVLSRNGSGSGETYTNNSYDQLTTMTEMSLWGTTFVHSNNNKAGTDTNILRTTADADGFFIPPDDQTILDADDTLMAGLSETIANIDDNLVAATGTISLTDIGQNWKYFVWDTERWDDWSADHFSGSTLDVSGGTAGEIVIDPDQTDVVTDDGTAFTFTAPQETDGEVDIVVASGEAVQTVECDKLSGSNCTLTLEGGNYNVTTIEDLRTTSSVPSSTFFTAKDCNFDGTLTWAPASGTTQYVVLDGVDVITGGTLTVQNTGAGTLNIIYRNGKPTTTTSNTGGGTLNEQVQKTITLEGTGAYDSSDIKMRYALTTDGGTPSFSTFSGTNDSTVTAATVDTNNTLITFTTAPTNTDLYYAIAYDEFDVVGSDGVTTDNAITVTMSNNFSGSVRWNQSTDDLNISGGTDWRNTTVSAISSGTAAIDVSVTETEGSTLSDILTRVWLRRYVVESNAFLEGVAEGNVNGNFIRLNAGQITLPNDTSGIDDYSRINFTHTASNEVFSSESRLLTADLGTDLFQSTDITTANVQTRITFAINATGVSAAELRAELNNRDLTKDNVGNLGLGVPAWQFNEGSLNTSPKVS